MGPLQEFFNCYPPFQYNPKQPTAQQWKRLCREARFKDDDYKKALARYKTALVKQFNKSYGESDGSLTAWHDILRRVGTTELPKTVKGCKEIIAQTHVNLVDLVDAGQGGSSRTVEKFNSEEDLAEYTVEEQKFFPRENAHAGNLLKFLLRHITSPVPDKPRSGRDNGGRKRKRGGLGYRG